MKSIWIGVAKSCCRKVWASLNGNIPRSIVGMKHIERQNATHFYLFGFDFLLKPSGTLFGNFYMLKVVFVFALFFFAW